MAPATVLIPELAAVVVETDELGVEAEGSEATALSVGGQLVASGDEFVRPALVAYGRRLSLV